MNKGPIAIRTRDLSICNRLLGTLLDRPKFLGLINLPLPLSYRSIYGGNVSQNKIIIHYLRLESVIESLSLLGRQKSKYGAEATSQWPVPVASTVDQRPSVNYLTALSRISISTYQALNRIMQ